MNVKAIYSFSSLCSLISERQALILPQIIRESLQDLVIDSRNLRDIEDCQSWK